MSDKLVLRTYELVTFGTYEGLPLEQAEYKEIMGFLNELREYVLELAQKVCDVIVESLNRVNICWNGESWVVME